MGDGGWSREPQYSSGEADFSEKEGDAGKSKMADCSSSWQKSPSSLGKGGTSERGYEVQGSLGLKVELGLDRFPYPWGKVASDSLH